MGEADIKKGGMPVKATSIERRMAYDQILSAIDGFSEAFAMLDEELRFRFVNSEAERILGKPRDELEGAALFEAFPAAKGSIFDEAIARCVEGEELVEFQTFFGTGMDARWYAARVAPADKGASLHLRELEGSSSPESSGDAVVREMNHRVKNTLSLISSLARLEKDELEDEAAKEALGRLERRIEASGLLYDMLARSRGIDSIDAANYLADLAALISANFASIDGEVRLDLSLQSLVLDGKRAAALGLAANEAMTNSYKYAFASDRLRASSCTRPTAGTLKIRLSVSGKTAAFLVEDDGPGFPAGFDPARDGDIGFALMIDKARELGGRLVAGPGSRGRGARVEISFPA